VRINGRRFVVAMTRLRWCQRLLVNRSREQRASQTYARRWDSTLRGFWAFF